MGGVPEIDHPVVGVPYLPHPVTVEPERSPAPACRPFGFTFCGAGPPGV